ncbi:T9SS type A sorting domain-containing protein [Winogradskyella poriferorum]|uniref:T9SS type A sorting domain-containing protein n=1 Tax=Winogradskyella poriferorum TaxID=307627 RepID=UPI003D656567
MKIKTTLHLLAALLLTAKMSYAQIESIGSSDYGRIFNITYDPDIENRLYATSLYNHILVSNDNGEEWEVLFSMSVHDVTKFKDLKMTKNSSALSFIKYNQSSSDNTLVIFDLNTNTIIDEIEIPYFSIDRYIKSYSIYEGNSNIILMNTKLDYGELENTYYTTDGGENWSLVYSKTENDGVAINDVAINPNNPSNLILTRGLGPTGIDGGLFVSNDAGETWIDKLPGVVLAPIAFNPHNSSEILVGTGISFGETVENLYHSTDEGDTWNIVPITWIDEQLNDITVIAYNANVPGKIVVLEENEILISNDNGATWVNHVHSSEDVYGYYYGTDLSFNPFNENEVFINSDYFPQFSIDGGVTLNWSKNNLFLSTGSLGLYLHGNDHIYYGVQHGFVHRDMATDLEDNFDILPINWYNQNDAPTLYVDDFVEGRVFTFSGGWFGSNLSVSLGHGQNKHQILNTFMNYFDAVATDPFDHNKIWISLSNTLGNSELISANINDLGAIETASISLPDVGFIRGIVFDPQQEGRALITIDTKVYRTEDFGNTWTLSNSGLEQLTTGNDLILSIDMNPFNTNQLAIATNQGIYSSEDGGNTWSQIYTELVHQVFYSDSANGYMVGTVHTSGISDYALMYSIDGGQNWTRIENEELLSVGSNASKVKFIDSDSAEVYISTIDLGLVKYVLNFQTLSDSELEMPYNTISVFPNPARDVITITSHHSSVESLYLFDLTGKLIIKTYGQEKLNISALNKGVYLLTINESSGKSFTKKIVKM